MQSTKRTTELGAISEIILSLVLTLALSAVGMGIAYLWGKSVASAEAQSYFLQMEKKWQAEIDVLQLEKESAEQEYKTTIGELNDRITDAEAAHKQVIAGLARDYADRMRKSENRAKTYYDMSQAGAAESAALAAHAAELDRTVEEGRHLVAELRETLGQRDKELTQLGEALIAVHQLHNDRKQ